MSYKSALLWGRLLASGKPEWRVPNDNHLQGMGSWRGGLGKEEKEKTQDDMGFQPDSHRRLFLPFQELEFLPRNHQRHLNVSWLCVSRSRNSGLSSP